MLAAGSMLHVDPFTLASAAAAAGFDGIGLRLSAEHALQPRERSSLRALVEALGLFIHDAEVHRISASSTDPRPLIEAAHDVGARNLLVVSDLPQTAEGNQQTEEELAALVSLCGTAGMRVGLEYMAWTNPCTSADAVRLAGATGAAVLVDVLHHTRIGEGVNELTRLVRSGRLGWVQVCDAPLQRPDDLIDEARHRRLPPGEGSLPIADLLSAISTDVVLSVEVQSDALAAQLTPNELAALLYAASSGYAVNTTG